MADRIEFILNWNNIAIDINEPNQEVNKENILKWVKNKVKESK